MSRAADMILGVEVNKVRHSHGQVVDSLCPAIVKLYVAGVVIHANIRPANLVYDWNRLFSPELVMSP